MQDSSRIPPGKGMSPTTLQSPQRLQELGKGTGRWDPPCSEDGGTPRVPDPGWSAHPKLTPQALHDFLCQSLQLQITHLPKSSPSPPSTDCQKCRMWREAKAPGSLSREALAMHTAN